MLLSHCKNCYLGLPRTSYVIRELVATHLIIIFQLLLYWLLNYLFQIFLLGIKVRLSDTLLLTLVTSQFMALCSSFVNSTEVTTIGSETFLARAFSVEE